MICTGVPAGATMPCHCAVSKPGRAASATVGTSGSKGERCAPVTASAISLPLLRCGNAGAMPSTPILTVPLTTSAIACPPPL